MATTKVKIRPDRDSRKGDLAIYVQVCIDRKVRLFPTGQKVNLEYWDEKNGKVKKMPGNNDHATINLLVEKKHQEIKEIIFQSTVNKEQLSFDSIQIKLEPKKIESRKFLYWFEQFKESKMVETKPSTHKNYVALYNLLMEFTRGKDFEIDTLDFKFFDKLKIWMLQHKNYTTSTVNKRLKTLKSFLKYCSDIDIFDLNKIKRIKVMEEKTASKIALTEEELEMLWKFDLTEMPKLEKVRDLFVFSCATGLRESDVQKLAFARIDDEMITLVTQKTEDELQIPLNKYSRSILEKYNNKLPKISQQKLNEYLKEVGRVVGLDEDIPFISYPAGKRKEDFVKKYELLKSHVGRRTFITLSIIKGIPIPVIQSITGHKDLASFQKYIKINNKAKVEAMERW